MNRPNSLFRNQLDFHFSLTGAPTSIAQRRGIRRNRGGRRLILTEGEAPRRCGGRHGTDHRIGSIPDQMSGSARLSGSKRIFEVVYFAVLFRGRAVTGE